MIRARTQAACDASAISDIHYHAGNRIHARAHLARLAPERFAQLQREWDEAATDPRWNGPTPEQKARAAAEWEALP